MEFGEFSRGVVSTEPPLLWAFNTCCPQRVRSVLFWYQSLKEGRKSHAFVARTQIDGLCVCRVVVVMASISTSKDLQTVMQMLITHLNAKKEKTRLVLCSYKQI